MIPGEPHNVYIDEFNGYDALAIEQNYSERSFITYIYEATGELKEFFLQKWEPPFYW